MGNNKSDNHKEQELLIEEIYSLKQLEAIYANKPEMIESIKQWRAQKVKELNNR